MIHAPLTNIGSGKKASIKTQNSLFNIVKSGENGRLDFIQECVKDPARYSKPIKRQPTRTFVSECVKFVRKGPGGKVQELVVERNLFGRTLYIALKNKNINLAEVLAFPNSPTPPSLCHSDGKMASTTKSTLFKPLEKEGSQIQPPSVDATIIDGMFLLYLLPPSSSTYGKTAEDLL